MKKGITSEQWEFIIDHEEKLPQGIHLWYKGVPYPRRVFHNRLFDPNFFLRCLDALGQVKKFLFALTFLTKVVFPRTLKIKKYELFLTKIYALIDWQLAEFWIKDDEFSIPVWEIGKGVRKFLEEIGLGNVAYQYSRVLMMILEFDCAYRYRVQDLIGETTKEILQKPRQEIKRLMDIYNEREGFGAREKMNTINLLGYALWIPKIKKAFLTALNEVDLDKIKFDINDRYHISWWRGYDYMGQDFDTRYQFFLDTHKGDFPPFRKRDEGSVNDFLTGD